MKTPLIIILSSLCFTLSGCVTGADGKQHLSPEVQAAANRIAVSTINAAEVAITAKLQQPLKVQPQK